MIFFSYLTATRKEKVAFLGNNNLVLLVSGHFTLETASERISMNRGEMLLIQKNQLGEITKMPLENEEYQTIVISLKEDFLRKIALEEQIEIEHKYIGPPNILIPGSEFMRAFFQSLIPYVRHPDEKVTNAVGMLKVKEAVYLLLCIPCPN